MSTADDLEPKIRQAIKLLVRLLIEQRIEIGALHSILAAKGLLTTEELAETRQRLAAGSQDVLDRYDVDEPDKWLELLRKFEGPVQ